MTDLPSPQHTAERLEAALQRVLDALPAATDRRRAFLLKRAGDVCVGMDERRKALAWYGRAVDQHLQLGEPEQAALLCRLIIHVQPDAVRARCTLTWIDLGTGNPSSAADHLASYVEAARRAGQGEMAAQQLAWMAEATADAAVRARIVAGLHALGQPSRAEAVASAPPSPAAQGEPLWARVLQATVGPAASAPRPPAS